MFKRAALVIAALALMHPACAVEPGGFVDNFRLIDQHGAAHELYYNSDKKAVVLMAYVRGCPSSLQSGGELEAVKAKYGERGVEFFLIDSSGQDAREALAQEAAAISLPILVDTRQLVGEQFELSRSGDLLMIDTKGWTVAYRGPVSELSNALDDVLAGSAIRTTRGQTSGGCPIGWQRRSQRTANAPISYGKDIAPLLMDKCVVCHREGGIGPWQMSRYEMIKGFAPMIREVVRTQRMPPWHADPHYSQFSNDRGLSTEQARKLVHWIEAGAPRGSGPDPLLSQKKDWPQWALGAPDLVVELPPFTVPKTGTIPYQMVRVKNSLDRDVWVRAVDFLPGQRAVLHHIVASASTSSRDFGGLSLNNYVPGAQPLQIPEGSGIFLPKGSTFLFQMHYTPNGQELTDVTRMGLYFMKEPPTYRYRSMVFVQPRLKIPAGAKAHTEVAKQTFKQDAIIYSLHPHAHFRGKASSFVAQFPDGREQTLLNVPAYDFNWQSTYELKEPLRVPAGTKVVYTQVFDNSAQNRANPDPARTVRFGEQTWDEMVFGVIRYRSTQADANSDGPDMQLPDFSEIFGADPPATERGQ
jgi:hypothetical protein